MRTARLRSFVVSALVGVMGGGCGAAAPARPEPATPAAAAHVYGGGLRSGRDASLPLPPTPPAGATGEGSAAGSAGEGSAAGSAGEGSAAGSAGEGQGAAEAREPAAPLEPRTVVLHIGDSFLLAGFSQALRPRMKSAGALYEVHSKQASYTTSWHLDLAKLVGDYHPDLVIINLGANEVTLTDPQARADAVVRLVKIVGDRPCVWVTPPLWRKDTGIIDVFRKNVAPCRFFDSDALVGPISRQPDAIHPDGAGGARWAEVFWNWLLKERAPSPKPGEHLPKGSGRHAVNPWRLRPPSPEKPAPKKP